MWLIALTVAGGIVAMAGLGSASSIWVLHRVE